MALLCHAQGQDGPLSLWDVFQGTVPGGLGTVPVMFTPTSLALLNTLSPPHRRRLGCWPLPRGINHGRGTKEGGQCPANSGKGGDLQRETVSPEVLLPARTANATIAPESRQVTEETRDIGTSPFISAAGVKLPQAQ